ncbi:unnamed protein product [Owenia fusiformis]|uniref:Uncharacterized protein n=1 Tax=Owenia fusiformis TaxID=6347 RepID=A0A8J1UF86_OWEFU|nr:unnamed protein product [Owenia fusiformis]
MESGILAAANTTPIAGLKCSLFPNNQYQCDVIVAVKRAMASLSLVGCLFMICVIVLFKKYAAFAQRLILYLSVAAFFDSVAYLMGELHPDGPLCDFQAWWLTYFDWSVLLWVCCITFNLYMNAIRSVITEKYEWVYHVLSWGFPLIMSCLPFINDHYGPAGAWCWIKGDDNGVKWRFGIWYGPLFLIIALLFFVYIYIIVMVNRRVKTWEGTYDPDTERSKQLLKEDIKPLKGYPFVYLAVSLFPLIDRIQNAFNPEPVFALMLLHVISSPLHGALNAIVFGMDKETMSKLTPSQIKVAVLNRTAGAALIREYPTGASGNHPTEAEQ